MATLMSQTTHSHATHAQVVLTVSGLDDSGADHWQALRDDDWTAVRPVAMGNTSTPHRNSWVTRLDTAIRQSEKPVILAAHGLACHAVAWWVALERPHFGSKVIGALLVNPPNIDAGISDIRLAGFGPTPKGMMPFPLIVAADRRDPGIDYFHAQMLAKFWGGQCIDVGDRDDAEVALNGVSWAFGGRLAKQAFGISVGQSNSLDGSLQRQFRRYEKASLLTRAS